MGGAPPQCRRRAKPVNGAPPDLAVAVCEAVRIGASERVEHLHGHRCERVGVVVDLDGPDVGLLLVPVESVDVILRAFVEIYGLFVKQHRCSELVHLADHRWAGLRGVDDHDVVGEDAAQVHLLGRESLPAPEPPPARSRRRAVVLKQSKQLLHVRSPEALVIQERKLEQAGLQMRRKKQQVVRIDQPFLGI